MPFGLGVVLVGDAEVLLSAVAGGAVVEVGEASDVPEKVKGPSVDEHCGDDGRPCPCRVFAYLRIRVVGPRLVGDLFGCWRRILGKRVWYGSRKQHQYGGGSHVGVVGPSMELIEPSGLIW